MPWVDYPGGARRNLKKGDMLRLLDERDKPVRYALATGGGFGSRRESLGRAIYVYHPRGTESEVIEVRDVPEVPLTVKSEVVNEDGSVSKVIDMSADDPWVRDNERWNKGENIQVWIEE